MTGPAQTSRLTRSRQEIARLLEAAYAHGSLVTAQLSSGVFKSLLRRVDPLGGRIVLGRSASEAANAELLARAHCSFHADTPERHIEFGARRPRAAMEEGVAGIECDFPELVATHPPRAHPRGAVQPKLALYCLADDGGVMPFDAKVTDISADGLGFLVYAADITLEPGTVLRRCRIDMPGGGACITHLEVRYSLPVTLPDGSRAIRSGCRFVDPGPELAELVRRYVREDKSTG